MTTKDTIEGLKDLKSLLITATEWVSPVIGAFRKFLSHAIQIVQAQDQSEGMLPEKKKIVTQRENDLGWRKGFNEMHDIAQTILAKKILKIQELENLLDMAKRLNSKQANQCLLSENISMKQELQSANKRIEELEEVKLRIIDDEDLFELAKRLFPCRANDKEYSAFAKAVANTFGSLDEVIRLREELQSLKSKLAVENLKGIINCTEYKKEDWFVMECVQTRKICINDAIELLAQALIKELGVKV